jgi:hypothetical protein
MAAIVPLFLAAAQSAWTAPVPVLGDDAVAPLAASQSGGDLAPGGPGFLLVWADERTTLGGFVDQGGVPAETDVWAMRLDAQGDPMDPAPILVGGGPFSQTMPRVAWNGTDWLVVWQSERPTTFFRTRNVVAARVSAAGVVLDDPPLVIDDADDVDEQPWDIASDGSSWAVFWLDVSGGSFVLDGATVTAGGVVSAPVRIVTPASSLYVPFNVRAEWAVNRYLLAYSRWGTNASSSDDIYARLLDASLNAAGGEVAVSTVAGWDQVFPSVGSDGAGFYVAWQDEQLSGTVFGTPVSTLGAVAKPDGLNLSYSLFLTSPIPSVAWNGMHWNILYEAASFPSGSELWGTHAHPDGDLVVGSPMLLAGPQPVLNTSLCALSATGVQAVWTDGRNSNPSGTALDLFGRQIAMNGAMTAEVPLAVGPPAQVEPDVAGTDDLRLAVWRSVTSGSVRILAQRLDFFGRPLDAQPIVLASGDDDLRAPAVAWDGTEWLVVWEDFAGSVFTSSIQGRRVAASGAMLDPAPIAVMPGNDPGVAAAAGDFLVVATHEPINHTRNATARRVDGASGTLLDPAPLQIGISYARGPAVTGFGDRWMTAWQRHSTHDSPYSTIRVNVVLTGGALLGETAPTFSTATSTQSDANLAAADAAALLLWHDGADLRGMRLDTSAVPLDPGTGFLVSGAAQDQFGGAAAWDDLRWQTAWTDWRAQAAIEPGRGDVYASRVTSGGAVLESAGEMVAAEPARPEGDPALSSARGASIAAVSALDGNGGRGNFVVETRFRGPALEVPALRRGQQAAFAISGGEPGDVFWLIASLAGEGPGACPPQMGGLCLDLRAPTFVIGTAPVGAAGSASVTVTVPPGARLGPVAFQAVLVRGLAGADTTKAPPVTTEVLP